MSVRIDFVKEGQGLGLDGFPSNALRQVFASVDLATTSAGTAAGARPVCPAGCNTALVTARTVDVVVQWGQDVAANPSAVPPVPASSVVASQDNGVLIPAGKSLVLGMTPGSFISAINAV